MLQVELIIGFKKSLENKKRKKEEGESKYKEQIFAHISRSELVKEFSYRPLNYKLDKILKTYIFSQAQ